MTPHNLIYHFERFYQGTFRTTPTEGTLQIKGQTIRTIKGYVLQTMYRNGDTMANCSVFITTEYEAPDDSQTFNNGVWHELPIYSIGFSVQENFELSRWGQLDLADSWKEEVDGFNDWLSMEFDV